MSFGPLVILYIYIKHSQYIAISICVSSNLIQPKVEQIKLRGTGYEDLTSADGHIIVCNAMPSSPPT